MHTVCVPVTSLTVEQAVHATLETVLELKEQGQDQVVRAVVHINRNTAILQGITAGLKKNDKE